MKKPLQELFKLIDDNEIIFATLCDTGWFKGWLYKNIHIYYEFEEIALMLKSKGKRDYYSGWAIINHLRWETNFSEKPPSDYKISNDCIAYLTRLTMLSNPSLDGMFKLKEGGGKGIDIDSNTLPI